MPHAIKLQEKYADLGLHVLLVEVQNHGRDEIVPFMAQAWVGKVPMGILGSSAPFNLPGNSIPKTGLVGVDGTLVWSGNGSDGVEKVLDEQLQRLHQIKPLEGPLKALSKDLNARNFGKAVTAARTQAEKGATDKVKSDAQELINHLTKTVDTRLAMAKRMTNAGRPYKAKLLLQQLAKQVNGDKDWSATVAAQIKDIEGSSKDDLAADKVVTEAEDMMKEKAGRAGAANKLADMLKKSPSVKVAKYAEELKKAAESKSALR